MDTRLHRPCSLRLYLRVYSRYLPVPAIYALAIGKKNIYAGGPRTSQRFEGHLPLQMDSIYDSPILTGICYTLAIEKESLTA